MSELSFRRMAEELSKRAARATLGLLSPANEDLRKYLAQRFEVPAGTEGSFLADPVCEAMFPWEPAAETLAQLSGGLLHPLTVDALDQGGFSRKEHPYKHQKRSWELLLTERRSILVTSGTGSGKTECFLVPILDDLARQAAAAGPLTGVQALFLYPLNALIASQRDRLTRWTRPFGGSVRFALFNGNTPERAQSADVKACPEEAIDRATLRKAPPPILVTNSVMLEYMLVRQQDRSILDASQGKLRWIVLDEAHTYVGSQAAEIALLLRRVMSAFAVESKDLRFIATSATIGHDEQAKAALQHFLADLGGLDVKQVTVVDGSRAVTPVAPLVKGLSLKEVRAASDAKRFAALEQYPPARKLRVSLTTEGAVPLSTLGQRAGISSQLELLDLLDLCHAARLKDESFLPLRMHFFHRTQVGLWSCVNPRCSGKKGLEGWPHGTLFGERRVACPHCNALVFEILLCTRCGEPHLQGLFGDDGGEGTSLLPEVALSSDDDGLDATSDADSGDEEEDPLAALNEAVVRVFHVPALYALPIKPQDQAQSLECVTGRLGGTATPNISIHLLTERSCIRCGSKTSSEFETFRSVRAGAPFYLQTSIPVLLEASAPHEKPVERPMKGRRTLTFTDSRQGSASFALRLQIEGERNFIRSWLWHELAPVPMPVDEKAKIQKQLELMKVDPELFQAEIASLEKQLAGASLPSRPWSKLTEKLAATSTVREVIKENWRGRYGAFSDSEVAETLLMRELMRRPARANSVETMGLVALDYAGLAGYPSAGKSLGIADDDWRSFLRSLLDHHLRNRWALSLPKAVKGRWLGIRPRSYVLVALGGEKKREKSIFWPKPKRVNGRWHRLVLMLARAAKCPPDDGRIADALQAAWDAIRPLLSSDQDGYVLDLVEKASVVAVGKGWLCPVSRRILPYTVSGWSPYLPEGDKFGPCAPIQMPTLAFPWGRKADGQTASPAEISNWLESDPLIRSARANGVWTDLHDRLSSPPDVILAAEHSAQQSPGKLKRYTEDFKAGRLNVLSCSTTMEMGVDIGGLSTVAMNNAPPHPANFFQRAGRAGRRGESAAASLTMCKAVPHGEAVFRNPMWAWRTRIVPPRVSLSSEPIVRRHLAALALGAFLRDRQSLKLVSRAFFIEPTRDAPLALDFRLWLEKNETAKQLAPALAQLARRTTLGARSPEDLLSLVAEDLRNVWRSWGDEEAASTHEVEIQQVLAKAKGVERTAALGAALSVQRRLHGEYLLRDLTARCFLPVHGFPTGLAQLVTSNRDSVKAENSLDADVLENEDQRGQRAFPTRDLPMAIREYAPGTAVTLDGKVYRPHGVTLNWRLPASEAQVKETQQFKYAWTCSHCGAGGVRSLWIDECPQCGESSTQQSAFLQPAGFAVDFVEEVSNDDSDRPYLPVEPPRVQGSGPWVDLVAAEVGKVRVTEEGQVVHLNRGLHGHGYAICLSCGRAAAETSEAGTGGGATLPAELQDHYRLRGGAGKNSVGHCDGNDAEFRIKRWQGLGAVVLTSVFELQFADVGGHPLNPGGLRAIAIALRQAVADQLGIETRELSWGVIPCGGGSGRLAVALFDTSSGGAGYVTQVPDFLPLALEKAADILDCPQQCDRACHACLLSFDTQHDIARVDRRAGLEILNKDFFLRLAPGKELMGLLGEGSVFEARPLHDAVEAVFSTGVATEVRIHLGGSVQSWDLSNWRLRDDIFGWVSSGISVTLLLTDVDLAKATNATCDNLRALLDAAHISVVVLKESEVRSAKFKPVLEIQRAGYFLRYALKSPDAAAPGPEWAQNTQVMRQRCDNFLPPHGGKALNVADLVTKSPENVTAVSRCAFGIDIAAAGQLLLKTLLAVAPEARARMAKRSPIASISYDDRYLQSAVGFRLALELARAIAGEQKPRTVFRSTNKSTNIAANFKTGDKDVPSKLMATAGTEALRQVLGPTSQMLMVEKSILPHHRHLVVTWDDGKIWRVDFDGGIGHDIRTPTNLMRLDALPNNEIVKRLATGSFIVTAETGRPPPPIYVWTLTQ